MNNGQARRSLGLVQKMLWLCETESWTKIDELLQAGASRHKTVRQDVKNEFRSFRTAGSLLEDLRTKEENYKQGMQKFVE